MEKYILFFSAAIENLRDDTGDMILPDQCWACEATSLVEAINKLLTHYRAIDGEELNLLDRYEHSALDFPNGVASIAIS